VNHSEVVFGVAFPARDDAPEVVQPSEQPLDQPAATNPPQAAAILGRRSATIVAVRSDQLQPVASAQPTRQWGAVERLVADQSLRRCRQEALAEGGFGEADLMRASAGQVHGERKAMAVCDRHDVAAFTPAIIAHNRAPFFASLKLPSMKASERSSLPRSRKSSASFCRICSSSPERCHC